ncbi:MAG TPA: class I SAM-dependent methyltransferase, partial [Polyangiaceae bacterium LLY-WYZ-15_(1-7)]|nr:class I SAM-dependent methyltransferase [Polyangiaceae bacterium LLY-WYZ-15_(1-7)]
MTKSFGAPRIEYVTTSRGPEPAQVERARAVAARCGVAFRERSRARPSRDGRVYVVERGRERLRRGAEALGVHVGMRAARRARGEAHPLLRALGPARRVVDGTAGLGQDAMHLADAGREVVAIEASPVVYSLLEAALPRLAPDVALRFGGAEAELAELEADAVYLDPMFRRV